MESNIAWFKLAESISKNERERALTLYRLLSYSLPSEKFRLQVLGDLYRSFGENELAQSAFERSITYATNEYDIYIIHIKMGIITDCSPQAPLCDEKITKNYCNDKENEEFSRYFYSKSSSVFLEKG